MQKKLTIPAEDIQPLVKKGGACFATDRITVDGQKVGYMYREAPDFEEDSGWRFFGGDETEEYASDPKNVGIYQVNEIANYDQDIIPLLDAPWGAEFERDENGGPLVPAEDEQEDE